MAGFEISGHLISKLEKVTGQGQKGEWQKQEFVIQTLDKDYPKTLAMVVWNDSIEKLRPFKKNEIIKVSFSAESRESKGRWYTELRAYKIEGANEPAAPPAAVAQKAPHPTAYTSIEEMDSNDLPF